MDDQSKATTLLRFGEFELDLEAGQLLKNSRIVRLQPQPFTLLCLLTSHPGKLLTREYVLRTLESEGHAYRQRDFCPLVTLWAWLSIRWN